MKIKVLVIALVLSAFSLSAFAKVDCSDPKNRPRNIAGTLMGGKKECYLTAEQAKRDLDLTIGRNPVTGEVTSRAKLAGGDNATMRLENAQMNYSKKKYELEEAEKFYADDPSTKNSNRLEKARKAFEKAQIDLKGAEEIKAKADMKKAK